MSETTKEKIVRVFIGFHKADFSGLTHQILQKLEKLGVDAEVASGTQWRGVLPAHTEWLSPARIIMSEHMLQTRNAIVLDPAREMQPPSESVRPPVSRDASTTHTPELKIAVVGPMLSGKSAMVDIITRAAGAVHCIDSLTVELPVKDDLHHEYTEAEAEALWVNLALGTAVHLHIYPLRKTQHLSMLIPETIPD